MPDQISINELKMFIGTGLSLYDTHRGHPILLHGISDDCFAVDCDNVDWPLDPHMGFTFKPMVKPLSSIEDIEEADKVDLSAGCLSVMGISEDIKYLGGVLKCCTFEDTLILASKHYDIFNWLNRRGRGRKSLAVKKYTNK